MNKGKENIRLNKQCIQLKHSLTATQNQLNLKTNEIRTLKLVVSIYEVNIASALRAGNIDLCKNYLTQALSNVKELK